MSDYEDWDDTFKEKLNDKKFVVAYVEELKSENKQLREAGDDLCIALNEMDTHNNPNRTGEKFDCPQCRECKAEALSAWQKARGK